MSTHPHNKQRRRSGAQQNATRQPSQDRRLEETPETTAEAPAPAERGRGRRILDYARPAIVLTLVMTLLLGFAYPGVVTGLAQVFFNHQANGSLVTKNGQPVGSALIGQNWTNPKYFHGRPSATLSDDGSSSQPYNGANSSASNNGPTSSNLQAEVQAELKLLKEDEACNAPGTPIPVDLVTSSGSGLDPDISAAGAMYQACRVAKERGMSVKQVQALIQSHIHDRTLGALGEPYVNVLELNMALDGAA